MVKIKQSPEDFIVEEIINLKTQKSGDYTYFWLSKKNWTTVRAIKEIARRCRTSFRRFKFAGTKDSNAITKQAVSAFRIEPEILKNVKIKDIDIEIIGKSNEQISLGDLKRNRFKIVIRDLTKKDLKKLDENKYRIKKGFLNYFGEQRFGGGNTHLVGKEIIRGYFELAVKHVLTTSEVENIEAQKFRSFAKKNWKKWDKILAEAPNFLGLEKSVLNWLVKIPNDYAGALRTLPKPIRKMYVHAYQSYIWNKALETMQTEFARPRRRSGSDLNIKKNKKLPIPGFETKLGSDKFSKNIKAILKEENIKLEDFKCSRMPELASEGHFRDAFVVPKKFKVSEPKNKSVVLEFELPKGAYATTLIAELFNGGVHRKSVKVNA